MSDINEHSDAVMNSQKTDANIEYLSEVASKKGARPLAVILLIILFGMIIATIISGAIGSKYFIGFLVLTMISSILMYVILWLGKVLSNQTK